MAAVCRHAATRVENGRAGAAKQAARWKRLCGRVFRDCGKSFRLCGKLRRVGGNGCRVGGTVGQLGGKRSQVSGTSRRVGGKVCQVCGKDRRLSGSRSWFGGEDRRGGGRDGRVRGTGLRLGGTRSRLSGQRRRLGGKGCRGEGRLRRGQARGRRVVRADSGDDGSGGEIARQEASVPAKETGDEKSPPLNQWLRCLAAGSSLISHRMNISIHLIVLNLDSISIRLTRITPAVGGD